MTPLVSICCITYNHAPFIRQCLDGFLMQETSFDIEILIHDDCSTDGTTEIIKEYAEKYPDKVFPLYETENQFKKLGTAQIDLFNYDRAQGKYIAYCEGDDYWTDPLKLQKQVNFMEVHSEYSVCFHRYIEIDKDNNFLRNSECDELMKESEEGIDLGLDNYFGHWYAQPTTMLFRKDCHQREWHEIYPHFCDSIEIYLYLREGKCKIMNFVGAAYRKHNGGIATVRNEKEHIEEAIVVADDIYLINKEPYAKTNWKKTILWAISKYEKTDKEAYNNLIRKERLKFPLDMFCIYGKIIKNKIRNKISIFEKK